MNLRCRLHVHGSRLVSEPDGLWCPDCRRRIATIQPQPAWSIRTSLDEPLPPVTAPSPEVGPGRASDALCADNIHEAEGGCCAVRDAEIAVRWRKDPGEGLEAFLLLTPLVVVGFLIVRAVVGAVTP